MNLYYTEMVKSGTIKLDSDVSLIVRVLTSSVLGSSCNSLIFGLILSSFLCLPFSCHFILPWGMLLNRKRTQSSQNEAEKEIIT